MTSSINKNYSKIIGLKLLLICFIAGNALALTADEKSPVKLNSESAVCNHQKDKDICIYSGNAKFDQGSTHLQGEQITIHIKGNKIEKIVASGKHSSYSTIIDNSQQRINATADLITIDSDKNIMILENNAQLVLGKDKYQGPYIKYKFK